jgi:Cof subfamily protein (haloacid dehalogenase superfamily)
VLYKLIVIDLDGTLLNDQHRVSVRTKAAIASVLEKGIKVVFASGRSQKGIFKVIDDLGIDTFLDYAICFNGANVLKKSTKESISKNILKGRDLQQIYNLAKEYGGFFYAYDNTNIFTDENNEYATIEAMKNGLQVVKKDIRSVRIEEDILKIIIAGRSEELDKLENNIPADFYNKFSIVRSDDTNLEFLHPLANKAEALKVLAKKIGISLDEVMAFGDAGNDIEMVKIAGKGIAMGNAFDEVIEIADYVTDTNNNDGVAKALEKFILERSLQE